MRVAEGRPPVPLRGHHLVCAFGFRGHGYSPAFAENMGRILRALEAAPDTPVRVVDVPDGICAAFPPDQPPHCEEPQVVARDRAVARAVGLEPGGVLAWGELRHRVARSLGPADLPHLCATCPWLPLGYCAEGLARARRHGVS
jgi:hypothetical protein